MNEIMKIKNIKFQMIITAIIITIFVAILVVSSNYLPIKPDSCKRPCPTCKFKYGFNSRCNCLNAICYEETDEDK
jgi:hypothetical protein